MTGTRSVPMEKSISNANMHLIRSWACNVCEYVCVCTWILTQPTTSSAFSNARKYFLLFRCVALLVAVICSRYAIFCIFLRFFLQLQFSFGFLRTFFSWILYIALQVYVCFAFLFCIYSIRFFSFHQLDRFQWKKRSARVWLLTHR